MWRLPDCWALELIGAPDATSPTFKALIEGQVNLYDAIRRQIDVEAVGKSYKLSENPAVLIVRYVCFYCALHSS